MNNCPSCLRLCGKAHCSGALPMRWLPANLGEQELLVL